MSFEWPKITFEQAPFVIIDGDRGVNYPKQQDFLAKGYCLFLNTGNVTTSGFNFSNCAFITKEKDDALRKGKLMRGDIVLTTRGTVGNVGFFSTNILFENIRINSGMVVIRPDPTKLVPYFMYLFLRSDLFIEQTKFLRSGSAQPQLPIRDMKRVLMHIPPINEQINIVNILSSLDNRISLLRETNTTLEAIAQTLFKSWFVDFDPVKANAEGRLPEGMDEATAALFPSEFEESALGLIPKGWRVGTLGDVVETVGGATPSTKETTFWEPSEFAWTTPKDLSGLQSPILLQTERKLSKKGIEKINSGLLPVGTLLLSSRAPIGYLAIAKIPVAINQGYIAMLPNGTLPPLYLLYWCKNNMDLINARANGSTFMEISKKAFRPIQIIVPSEATVRAFLQILDVLFDRLTENEKQSQTLTTLRDTLLPRLISGQLSLGCI